MYHKKGVITEERFQKMTEIQWLYHYSEIKMHMGYEDDKAFQLVKSAVEAITSALENGAKLTSMISNPEVYSKYLEVSDTSRESDEDIEKIYEEIKKDCPIIWVDASYLKKDGNNIPTRSREELGLFKVKSEKG